MQPRRRAQPAQTIGLNGAGPSNLGQTSAPVAEPAAATSNMPKALGSRGRSVPGLQRGGFKATLSEDADTARKADRKQARDEPNMAENVTGVQQTDPVMAAYVIWQGKLPESELMFLRHNVVIDGMLPYFRESAKL